VGLAGLDGTRNILHAGIQSPDRPTHNPAATSPTLSRPQKWQITTGYSENLVIFSLAQIEWKNTELSELGSKAGYAVAQ
jgi:hypothetical protein